MKAFLIRYSPLVILALGWEVIARLGLISSSALPPLSKVAEAWIDLARSGDLTINTLASLWRTFAGLALAILWARDLNLMALGDEPAAHLGLNVTRSRHTFFVVASLVTGATVASCAQIGARVHLSGGVGIGGVLEPPNAVPVVVEDEAFIGSRSMITDGARVGRGAVLGAGTILNPSIPVIDAETGEEISRGVVPPWSVAVSANRKRTFPGGDFYLPCVLVLKTLTEGERHDKVALNEVLRTHSVAT